MGQKAAQLHKDINYCGTCQRKKNEENQVKDEDKKKGEENEVYKKRKIRRKGM